jgi:hypothetical protein
MEVSLAVGSWTSFFTLWVFKRKTLDKLNLANLYEQRLIHESGSSLNQKTFRELHPATWASSVYRQNKESDIQKKQLYQLQLGISLTWTWSEHSVACDC